MAIDFHIMTLEALFNMQIVETDNTIYVNVNLFYDKPG